MGYNSSTLFLREINIRTLSALDVGGISNVRYYSMIISPLDWDPRKTALTVSSSKCKLQTYPLIREDAPHQ
jgi:hypothetical protein